MYYHLLIVVLFLAVGIWCCAYSNRVMSNWYLLVGGICWLLALVNIMVFIAKLYALH